MMEGLAGIIGAAVGALAVLASQWVQARAEERRARSRLALQAAVAEYEAHRTDLSKRGGYMLPLVSYVYFHSETIRLIEADNLTPDSIRDLQARHDELKAAYRVQASRRGVPNARS